MDPDYFSEQCKDCEHFQAPPKVATRENPNPGPQGICREHCRMIAISGPGPGQLTTMGAYAPVAPDNPACSRFKWREGESRVLQA